VSERACDPDVESLQRVAALGWRPVETERLGEWLLRAAGGFTGRANSALPLGDPGRPLPLAVDRVERWYRERDLPPRFLVPTPTASASALDPELDRRGWTYGERVRLLVAPVGGSPAERAGDDPAVEVRVDATPGDDWVAAYHYRGTDVPPHARAVLTAGDEVGFVSLRSTGTGRLLAIARGSVDADAYGTRWLGVTAVEVDPGARGRGLGRAVMRAVLEWGGQRGASCCYLQVFEENASALAMYDRLGFVEHHRYHYRLASTSRVVPLAP
jgi:N-acetylglutamate synthase